MARYEENSRLRTLADAVSGPLESDVAGAGGNGVWDSGPGLDIDEARGELGRGGGRVERPLGRSQDGAVAQVGAEVSGEMEAAEVLSGNVFSFASDGKIEEQAVVGGNGTDGEEEDEEDDGEYAYEHGFSVGDLVWGKIKSHPWWPGQIYDSKDASENALKFNQKNRLLVAYFGDSSFAWCTPSQLIPFAEHFEDMSKQSNTKTFTSAVQEAVDEIGRLVEMEMTCKCVSEENRKGLDTPLSENAGIKTGIRVPEGDIGKLLSFRYDSPEILATVESIGDSVSFANMLDLAILKGWLSAFYRSRGGGYSLPVCHEGLLIEGLEDKSKTEVHMNDMIGPNDVPIQGPQEEDWSSAAVSGPGSSFTPSEDKIYHRRKQKSVAELMGGVDIKIKNRKQKRMATDETGNHSDGIQVSGTGRKRGRKKTGEMTNGGESVHVQGNQAILQNPVSTEMGEGEAGDADHKDDEGTKGTEEISSPRERKKSKYLSPPYTSAQFGTGKLSSKKEVENESTGGIGKTSVIVDEPMAKPGTVKLRSKKEEEKESVRISKIARIGERMTKAAGILLDTPPMVKCNGPTKQEKISINTDDDAGQLDSSVGVNPSKSKQDEKMIETMDVNAAPNEVLDRVVHVAVNPLYSWDENLLVPIKGFISSFRSSSFRKRKRGRKRSSSKSEPGKVGNGDASSAEAKKAKKIRPSVGEKTSVENSEAPRKKKKKKDAKGGSVVKLNEKKVQEPAAEDDCSQLGSVRQKLQIMASMLEKCDGKISPDEVSNLDIEIKNLFDKVRKITEEAVS